MRKSFNMINTGDSPMHSEHREDPIREDHARIIKEELVKEMDKGLEYIQTCLGQMFGEGLAGWFLNPIARLIYHIMARKDIRDKTIRQIDVVLDCAMKFNGSNLDGLIEEHFEDYMLNDQSFHRCKKNHKAYPVIEGIMKDLFKSRIGPAHKLIISQGTCYEELTRIAFTEKQAAMDNLQRELEFSYKVLGVIKENKKVVKLPSFVRQPIIRIMELGQKYAKERLSQRIDEIYEFDGHQKE